NYIRSQQALDWTEKAIHQSLKNSGLTYWDSLVPFNFANIRECEAIREVLQRAYNDGDDTTASDNYAASDRRKKRRAEGMINQQSAIDEKLNLTKNNKSLNGNKLYHNYINYILG
ncbi:unnamed protein product, partial [Meganyctiphanes norvegica]